MSLCTVTDAFLAARVRAHDQTAFAELARRYRPLLLRASARSPRGVEPEDLRQEALLGLALACAAHRPGRGSFATFAVCNVRWRVAGAWESALRHKQRVLSDAVHDGDSPAEQVIAGLAAPYGSDPAVVVELREQLCERVQVERERARRPRATRRRYSPEEIETGLRMIAAGRTIREVTAQIGAPGTTVRGWARQAGMTATLDRRRFSAAEIEHVLALLEQGATHEQAGAAVGATASAVAVWVRRTGRRGNGRRRAFNPDEVRHALALVRSGASAKQAAAVIGASSATVQRWKREAA